MASYEATVKKEQAIANNLFVRRVRQYGSYKEYQKYNKSRYDTFEEEKYYINEKVKRDMTKCACNDNTDVRERCNPMDLRFRICPMRLETAKWFISNKYNQVCDYWFFTDDEIADLVWYMTIHPCDCCKRECCYYDDDTRGPCGTRDCCKIMCYQCAYYDGGDYYCQKCRDEMIEKGEWVEEEQENDD